MADIMFNAGQALSVIGLVYGWVLTLTFSASTQVDSALRGKPLLLQHEAMA